MDGLATERVLRPRPFARRRVDGFGSQDFGESIYKLPSISNTFWNGYNKGIPMAKRKRKSKKMKPAEQPQAAQKAWRSIFRIVAGVVIIGVVAGAFWHLRSRQPMVSQSQLPPAVTHPSETQPQTPLPQTKIKHSERGYLEWETQETDLGDGKKRIEGRVRWN